MPFYLYDFLESIPYQSYRKGKCGTSDSGRSASVPIFTPKAYELKFILISKNSGFPGFAVSGSKSDFVENGTN